MYKLLIVDDEETIREGLCSVVDWKSMGFEVLRAVEDGEEAVDFIDKNPVDVILTDVKMTFMSGLELAKYVQANKPHIKVAIISGYKEFEFARQAMSHNVRHYLLKPTRLEELRRVFLELKTELDREAEEKEKSRKESQQRRELLLMSQEQFFTDLIMGALPNKEDVDRRLKKTGLDLNPGQCKICVASLSLHENTVAIVQDQENESLYATLRNYIANKNGSLQYYTIYSSARNMKLLAVTALPMEEEELVAAVKSYTGQISSKIKVITGMEIRAEVERTFGSMYETAIHFKPLIRKTYPGDYRMEEVISRVDHSHLESQQKLLISYIRSDKPGMAADLFENILNELVLVDRKVVLNWTVSLFSTIRSELSALGPGMRAELFDYEAVFRCDGLQQIKAWGRALLNSIAEHVKKYKDSSEKRVIQKAKEYIKANYDKDIGLEEVADTVYLSSIYFSRLFKKQTNENFVDYLVKVRMRKAKELLQDPRLKVYEVSIRIGYKNTKYFYKLFKDYTGLTPAEYRENFAETGDGHE